MNAIERSAQWRTSSRSHPISQKAHFRVQIFLAGGVLNWRNGLVFSSPVGVLQDYITLLPKYMIAAGGECFCFKTSTKVDLHHESAENCWYALKVPVAACGARDIISLFRSSSKEVSTNFHGSFHGSKFTSVEISTEVDGNRLTSMEVSGSFHRKRQWKLRLLPSIAASTNILCGTFHELPYLVYPYILLLKSGRWVGYRGPHPLRGACLRK